MVVGPWLFFQRTDDSFGLVFLSTDGPGQEPSQASESGL